MAVTETRGSWHSNDTAGVKTWVAEVSDLKNDLRPHCPMCLRSIRFGYQAYNLAPIKDPDGDIIQWKGFCQCGVELRILND
jgi:hypothetical protein